MIILIIIKRYVRNDLFIDFQIFSDHKIAKKDGHKVKLRMELRIVNV